MQHQLHSFFDGSECTFPRKESNTKNKKNNKASEHVNRRTLHRHLHQLPPDRKLTKNTACWLSVALCTVCMPMLFARCSLRGVWQLVRSLTPNTVFTQVVVTLCNPCSFFGTYNMLHEQLNPMGRLGCTLLSLILNKPMTPFQGMHYGNTLGVLTCLRFCCL